MVVRAALKNKYVGYLAGLLDSFDVDDVDIGSRNHVIRDALDLSSRRGQDSHLEGRGRRVHRPERGTRLKWIDFDKAPMSVPMAHDINIALDRFDADSSQW